MKRNQRDTLARSAMKTVCFLLGLILAILLISTVLFQNLFGHRRISTLSQDGSILSAFSAIELSDLRPGSGKDVIGGPGSDIVNILMVGQDRREGESQSRSDSMILCTFNKETHQLIMTSFLRDLYVPIPGYHANRINAAYSAGGIQLLERTLQENFGLYIDGSIEVDFSQFAQIVDVLGGVEIELRQDEAEVVNQETGSDLSAGVQTLDGAQALAYSRIRKLDADGDFSRTNRQRKVMTALIGSYKDAGLNDLLPLVEQLLPMIETDMSYGKLLLLGLELLPHLSGTEIVSQHVPEAGTYTDQTIDGMAVLVADSDAVRQMLEKTLLGS